MNREQIAGDWMQLKGIIKEKWGKLTDDDIKAIEGKREILAGKIQEKYGIAKEEAEKLVDEFFKSDRKEKQKE